MSLESAPIQASLRGLKHREVSPGPSSHSSCGLRLPLLPKLLQTPGQALGALCPSHCWQDIPQSQTPFLALKSLSLGPRSSWFPLLPRPASTPQMAHDRKNKESSSVDLGCMGSLPCLTLCDAGQDSGPLQAPISPFVKLHSF